MTTAFFRTIVLYAALIIGLRLTGKRQIGELEPNELVLTMLLSDLAAVPMQDFGIPLLTGVIPILVLLTMTMILSVLTMKFPALRALLCGKPSIVIRNGKPDRHEMRRNRLTVDELLEELRMNGYTDLTQIRYAILETSGRLSVLPYANQKPPCAQQLNLRTSDGGLPRVIISDGTLLQQNLTAAGLDAAWLTEQLKQHHAPSPAHVFLMTVDELGKVYFVPREVGA